MTSSFESYPYEPYSAPLRDTHLGFRGHDLNLDRDERRLHNRFMEAALEHPTVTKVEDALLSSGAIEVVGHGKRTGSISVAVAVRLGLTKEDGILAGVSGIVHDWSCSQNPEHLAIRRSRQSFAENPRHREITMTHPEEGARMLADIDAHPLVAQNTHSHHGLQPQPYGHQGPFRDFPGQRKGSVLDGTLHAILLAASDKTDGTSVTTEESGRFYRDPTDMSRDVVIGAIQSVRLPDAARSPANMRKLQLVKEAVIKIVDLGS